MKPARALTWLVAAAVVAGLGERAGAETGHEVETRSCAPVGGVGAMLAPGSVLLLGEIHGTVESPAFAAALLCHGAAAGRSLTLGLELSEALDGTVGEYLASSGSPADRRNLVERSRQIAAYLDGRFSEAVVELIEAVRQLRSEGAQVDLVLFAPASFLPEPFRQRRMAERIGQVVEASGDGALVALMGLSQSRVIRGSRWDADFAPLGYLLSEWYPQRRPLSLSISHSGGTAWVCTSSGAADCRPLAITGHGRGTVNSIQMVGDPAATGHHGVYFVGELSFSPPARPMPLELEFSREAVTELPLETVQKE